MTRIAYWIAAAVAVSALFLAAGCGKRETVPDAAAGTLKVVATTGMIADIAKRIAGDEANVTALMGPGTDPHLYKAAERDIRLLAAADLVLYNGLHLEGKMGEVLESLARKKAVIAVAESIDESRLVKPPAFAGNFDPHVWFDVSMWSIAAARIRDALIEAKPAAREDFERRFGEVERSLAQLHEFCRSQLAMIPEDRRVLVTAHDAFGYFGKAYGIEVRGIQGISTEDEAGVGEINSLVDFLVEKKIPAVFVESSVPKKNVEALIEGARSRGAVVKIGGQLFSDAMGAAGTTEGTYEGMVRHNVNTIVEALSKTE
ncbi:zinc ABC transporter substrate-binding protein [bacterium]|nr:zinc ABC transporter substrate-binding protein [bacterium]